MPEKYEIVKQVHQAYRDCLSQTYVFPSIGNYPPDLIKWVIDVTNTDIGKLAELLYRLPPTSLEPDHDLALRLLFFTILQANLVHYSHNYAPDFSLSPVIIKNVKNNLNRILSLHPTHYYLINAVQLLFRLQEIEEVIKTSQSHPQLFEDIPQLRAIIGFIYMLSGEYAQAMYYIKPLLQEPEKHPIPNITLWGMTCQYFLGETPTQPFSFESLKQDKALLAEHIKHLPKMEMLQPLSSSVKRPVVFVACNDDYFFQHIFHLAYSLHSTNAETLALHLHLYTPNPKILAEIEQLKIRVPGVPIGVSVEYGETQVHHTATYYASARFIRAFQLMEHYSNEIIVLDADTLFNRNWSDFSVQFLPQDEIVLACPAASPFWERVLAGFLYLKPTPLARDFMAQVAHFILDNIERQLLHWFVDQVALSVCDDRLTRNNPAVKHFPSEKLIDIHCTSQALIWAVTTNKMGPPSYQARREKLEKDYANADTP